MSTPVADKKAETVTALKNANKHLTDVFADLARKDRVLSENANELQRVANQCGDILVMAWIGTKQEAISLKKYLNQIATSLNEAR